MTRFVSALVFLLALASPLPAQSAKPTARLTLVGAQHDHFVLEYEVTNSSKQAVYLIASRRMPYVMVGRSPAVELHFDVESPGNTLVYLVEIPDFVTLSAGQTYRKRLRVAYPLLPSDHYHYPGPPAPTGKSFSVEVIQGYGLTPFDMSGTKEHLNELLKWQNTIRSNTAAVRIP